LFLPPILSVGNLNALVPIMVIIVLIAAAAGATRGFSLFNLFGVASLLGGMGSVGGGSRGGMAKSGFPLRTYLDAPKGAGIESQRGIFFRRRRGGGPTGMQKKVARNNLREGSRLAMLAAMPNPTGGRGPGMSPKVIGGKKGRMAAGSGGWVKMAAGTTAAVGGVAGMAPKVITGKRSRGAATETGGPVKMAAGTGAAGAAMMAPKVIAGKGTRSAAAGVVAVLGKIPIGFKRVPVKGAAPRPVLFTRITKIPVRNPGVKTDDSSGVPRVRVLSKEEQVKNQKMAQVKQWKFKTLGDAWTATKEGAAFTGPRVPVLGPLGVYGLSKLNSNPPKLKKTIFKAEEEHLNKVIAKQKGAIAENNEKISKIAKDEKLSPTEAAKQTRELSHENDVINARVEGMEKRKKELDEGVKKLEVENIKLMKGEISDDQHKAIFNQTYDRLYPEKPSLAESVSTAKDNAALVGATVPAAAIATGEAAVARFQQLRASLDKSYKPDYIPNFDMQRKRRGGVFKSYNAAENARLKVIANSYDPKKFSEKFASDVAEDAAMQKAAGSHGGHAEVHEIKHHPVVVERGRPAETGKNEGKADDESSLEAKKNKGKGAASAENEEG